MDTSRDMADRLARRRNRVLDALPGWGFEALLVPGRGVFKDHAPLEWLIGALPQTRPVRLVLTRRDAVALVAAEADAATLRATNPGLEVRVVPDFVEGYLPIWGDAPRRGAVAVTRLGDLLPIDEWQALAAAGCDPVADGGRLERLCTLKDDVEQAGLLEAAEIAAHAYQAVADAVRTGVRPAELAALGHCETRRSGAREVLFYVCDGLHHGQQASPQPLRPGALVTIYSEVLGPSGYWAEQIGMVALGEPAPAARALIAVAAETLAACERELSPEGTTHGVLRAAREAASEGGLRLAGTPGIAHGVGVGDADWPRFAGPDQPLSPGMALVLHPNVSAPAAGLSACAGGTYLVCGGRPERLAPVPVLTRVSIHK